MIHQRPFLVSVRKWMKARKKERHKGRQNCFNVCFSELKKKTAFSFGTVFIVKRPKYPSKLMAEMC